MQRQSDDDLEASPPLANGPANQRVYEVAEGAGRRRDAHWMPAVPVGENNFGKERKKKDVQI